MEEIVGNSVLVIDDDAEVANLVKHILLPCEDEIQIATTGRQGLALAEEGTPDLIFLDLVLPDMDGWAVYARLKAMPDLWSIPIVLTESSPMLDYAHAKAVGATGYLAKPWSPRELLAARDAALSGETYYPPLPSSEEI